jgi:tryptophanyl-tRNA synthetase
VKLQHEYPGEAFYFIANYHALTTVQDMELLRKQTLDVAIDYLALGLDPSKATFYRQSDVPQVCELSWILSTVTGKGLLDRAVSYKDKLERGLRPSLGLFMYPVLMAADILAVRATIVPVGADQVQHLEMTRAIAGSFNAAFAVDYLPLPATELGEASTVPGLDGKKMSKTYDNTIAIFADDDELEAKVMHIRTGSEPLGDALDPETDTVFALYKMVAAAVQVEEMRARYEAGDIGYKEAKAALLIELKEFFGPYREKRLELAADTDVVEDVLRDGAERAREEVAETVELVREATGLGRYQRVIA